MKHDAHIERIALGEVIDAWRRANDKTTWAATARIAGISRRRCKRVHTYFVQRADEPRIPECGELSHAAVVRYGRRGIVSLRDMLIRNFSATIGLAKPVVKMSNGEVRKLADAVGLENFSHRGRRVIHWKHSPPRIKRSHDHA